MVPFINLRLAYTTEIKFYKMETELYLCQINSRSPLQGSDCHKLSKFTNDYSNFHIL